MEFECAARTGGVATGRTDQSEKQQSALPCRTFFQKSERGSTTTTNRVQTATAAARLAEMEPGWEQTPYVTVWL